MVEHAPFGAEVWIDRLDNGMGWAMDPDAEATKDAMEAMEQAFGVAPVNKGEGGSIPFIPELQRIFPNAQVLVTGPEDPKANAHSPNESISLPGLKNNVITEALLNVRERKYEIGVLTAIGVNKVKVAAQFTLELLIVTMIGLALGAGIGAAASVPVSNQLLSSQIAQQQSQQASQREQFGRDMQGTDSNGAGSSSDSTDGNSSASTDSSSKSGSGDTSSSDATNDAKQPQGGPGGMMNQAANYVSSINATVNLAVVGQLLLVGIGLTLVAALVAVIFVLRYEPLQILADRS